MSLTDGGLYLFKEIYMHSYSYMRFVVPFKIFQDAFISNRVNVIYRSMQQIMQNIIQTYVTKWIIF